MSNQTFGPGWRSRSKALAIALVIFARRFRHSLFQSSSSSTYLVDLGNPLRNRPYYVFNMGLRFASNELLKKYTPRTDPRVATQFWLFGVAPIEIQCRKFFVVDQSRTNETRQRQRCRRLAGRRGSLLTTIFSIMTPCRKFAR